MPQTITTGYKALVEAAEKEIETIPTAEAIKLANDRSSVGRARGGRRPVEPGVGRVRGSWHAAVRADRH